MSCLLLQEVYELGLLGDGGLVADHLLRHDPALRFNLELQVVQLLVLHLNLGKDAQSKIKLRT